MWVGFVLPSSAISESEIYPADASTLEELGRNLKFSILLFDTVVLCNGWKWTPSFAGPYSRRKVQSAFLPGRCEQESENSIRNRLGNTNNSSVRRFLVLL